MEQRKTAAELVGDINTDLRRMLELMGIYRLMTWLAEKAETHWPYFLISMLALGTLLLLPMFIAVFTI
jgi:hypothetical protein